MLSKTQKAVYKAIEYIESVSMIGRYNLVALHEIFEYAGFTLKKFVQIMEEDKT